MGLTIAIYADFVCADHTLVAALRSFAMRFHRSVCALPLTLFGCSRARSGIAIDARVPTAASAAPSIGTRVITVRVASLFAVGWADSPAVSIEGAPPDTSATLYIPAGRSTDAQVAACWREHGTAVGDRFRLTIRRSDPDGGAGSGGPYRLRIVIREGGTGASWDVLACDGLGPAPSTTT